MRIWKTTMAVGFLAAFLMLGSLAAGSQIVPLELDKLESRSNLIVLGVVDELVASNDWSDTVTVRVIATLKGSTDVKSFKLQLRNRGVKDFDPTLAPGDQGVFFLKSIDDGHATLAYWGSIAVTPKRQNFTVPPAMP